MATPELSRAERARIAKSALENAATLNDVPELSMSDIDEMSLEELVQSLKDNGVEVDLAKLEADAQAALGSDGLLFDRGANIDAAKLQQLEDRTDKAIERGVKALARDTIRQLRAVAFEEGDDRPPEDRFLMWVAVIDPGTCSSCEDRHGYVQAADYWIGESPGDGTTICRDNCRCVLIPVDATSREITAQKNITG